MYDVSVALRRFKPLIRWVARHYANPNSYRMSQEDIEAEGLMTLVNCCQKFPDTEIYFARFFKRSLYNRVKKLHSYTRRLKRQGVNVSLDDLDPEKKFYEGARTHKLPEQLKVAPAYAAAHSDFLERMQARVAEVTPYLSADAARFLQMLVNPNEEEITRHAWMEFCRRNKLRSLGIDGPSCNKFRVKKRHIGIVLQMTSTQMSKAVKEIQTVEQKLARRRIKIG